MAYNPQMTTLAYIVRDDQVLLCHRRRRTDQQVGKYNGMGGKMERHEDPLACLRREVDEETGLVITACTLRGTVSWPGFGPDGEDIFGFVFLVTDFDGEPPSRNDEGDLGWHTIATMMDLPMWDGDRHFLPLVFDEDPRPFHMVLPYENGHCTGVTVSR